MANMVFAKGEGDKQIWMAKSCLFAGVPRKGGGRADLLGLSLKSAPANCMCMYFRYPASSGG